MALQKRNSEMVDLLRADFVHKHDSAYVWAMLLNMYSMIPGITAFWSMGAYSEDDKVRFGNKSYYDLTNERLVVGFPPVTAPGDATLAVARGTGTNGTATFLGTTQQSHFNFSTNEDTYIRGGKTASKIVIGDANTGGILTGTGPFISFNTVGDGWKNLTFTNAGGTTWANFGGGYQACQYQIFGDWLMIRGLATRTAGAGIIIGNLPINYRPATAHLGPTISNDAIARLEIQPSGNIQIPSGYAAWVAIWANVSML